MPRPLPIDREISFDEEELIVSKTDRRGAITYANSVFCRVSGYQEKELIGSPHSIVRHPDMPRCVFKYMWETIEAGQEIFAYVKNLAKGGEYYWVLAHVTPTFDERQDIIGYHSTRRLPSPAALDAITSVYTALIQEERRHTDPRESILKSYDLLLALLQDKGMTYDMLVWSIT